MGSTAGSPGRTAWSRPAVGGSTPGSTARPRPRSSRGSAGPAWSRGGWCCSRSEEHTSELQSRGHLVCRLLLEKKKKKTEDQVSVYKQKLLLRCTLRWCCGLLFQA